MIINGEMQVAQRNTSTVAVADGSNEGYATLDRWNLQFGNSAGGGMTTGQDTEAPAGFGTSYKLDVTATDTISGNELVYAYQCIEAQNMRNCGWEYTSTSSDITLSFWVRSSKTGIYCVFFSDADAGYMYTAEYTVSDADTWEKKTITVPGHASLVFNNDTGLGLQVGFVFGNASGRYGTAGAWLTGTHYGTSNQVNFLDSISNVMYLTGVQLELGSNATPFEHRSYGEELALCSRYYQNSFNVGNVPGTSTSSTDAIHLISWGDGNCSGFPFQVPMRAAPSIVLRAQGSTTTGQVGSEGTARAANSNNVGSKQLGFIAVTSGTASTYVRFTWEADAEL
tara:strand:- start:212 stop:1228 length:1017 start_codon:yes stop_codon:yes gene_type:complete